MLLSVVIPVCNERHTLGAILRVVTRTLPDVSKEIIVDDDCSKDGTREWLKANSRSLRLSGIILLSRGGLTIWRTRKWVSPERP